MMFKGLKKCARQLSVLVATSLSFLSESFPSNKRARDNFPAD